ncbi:MAG: GTPase Era [Alphaproteobacteria bacterium]|nr:GTPase Era [Alphaproteobacteria bacterium]
MSDNTATRCGFAAIIGAPNAGKSTLVNRLTGTKVSIVSPKVQTTRTRVRGIMMAGEAQAVLVDTPGIFAPKRKLDEAMVSAALEGASEADVTVLVVDAASLAAHSGGRAAEETRAIIAKLKESKRDILLVLNKIDLMKPPQLLALAADLNASNIFVETFMVSAETSDGVAALSQAIARRMPLGPWLYPPDQAADLPQRLLAAEITREKLFLRLHDELPYASTVETDSWSQQKDGSARIEQTIFVERDSQKAIVIGKGGQSLKQIGASARVEMTSLFGHPVHLFLFVKVRPNWAEEPARFREMGLAFPKAPRRG